MQPTQQSARLITTVTDISNLSTKIRGSKNLWYHPSQFLGLNCMFLLCIHYFDNVSLGCDIVFRKNLCYPTISEIVLNLNYCADFLQFHSSRNLQKSDYRQLGGIIIAEGKIPILSEVVIWYTFRNQDPSDFSLIFPLSGRSLWARSDKYLNM